jgi:hypothetical protein
MSDLFLVHDVPIAVESQCRDFSLFLRENYRGFLAREHSATPRIVVTIRRVNTLEKPPEKFAQGSFLIGKKEREVYIRAYPLDNVNISLRRDGEVLIVNACIKARKARLLSFSGTCHKELFYLARYAFTYPLFLYNEFLRDTIFLHALGIEKNKNAFLFFGLPGCGKTFLGLNSAACGLGALMADNFIFLRDDAVMGFPELMRLDTRGTYCASGTRILEPTRFKVYRKRFYRLPYAESAYIPLRKAFILNIGQRNAAVKVSLEEFARRLRLIEACTKEFMEYAFLKNIAAELGLIAPRREREDAIGSALQGKETFIVHAQEGLFDKDFVGGLLC